MEINAFEEFSLEVTNWYNAENQEEKNHDYSNIQNVG